MPIIDGVIRCPNHPKRRMFRNNRPTVLHPVDLVDGQPAALPHRGIFLAPWVCTECGYAEFYVIDKDQLSESWLLPAYDADEDDEEEVQRALQVVSGGRG